MSPNEEHRWLYTLQVQCLFFDSTPRKVERALAQIHEAIDGEELRTAAEYDVALGSIDSPFMAGREAAPGALITIVGLEATTADAIARRLAGALETKAPGANTKWTVTAQTDDHEELSPAAIALGINESGLLAPNSMTVRGTDSDIASVVTTTSDMVHFNMLNATVGDPDLWLLSMDTLNDELIDNYPFDPDIAFDPENYGIRVHGAYQNFMKEGFIRNLDLFLSTYEDVDYEQFATLARFISNVAREHWPVVANAVTECQTKSTETVESNILIDGEGVAEWSIGLDDDHAFGPINIPDSHGLHFDHLPRTNLQLMLLTLAIRHAEIHALGTPFTHACSAWQAVVHDIAQRIRTELHDLPKWRGVFMD